jgi:PKD repeat protein
MAIIAAVGYLGYQVVPVFYQSRNFESFMQDTVDAAAITNKKPAWVEEQLKTALPDYDVPPEAVVKSTITRGRIEAQVQFTRTIPMLVTQYKFDFDKTVRSATGAAGG